jgi:hypothetical protein
MSVYEKCSHLAIYIKKKRWIIAHEHLEDKTEKQKNENDMIAFEQHMLMQKKESKLVQTRLLLRFDTLFQNAKHSN